MKLFKLSLAAAVAAGAFSVASATPLEEAIKDVDVSGFAFYRYQNHTAKPNGGDSASKAYHKFRTVVNFKATIDDNFFAVLGFDYNSNDVSGDHKGTDGGITNVGANGTGAYGQTLNVKQAFLGYKAGNTTIQAGRQTLGTFYTADMVGTGIKVLNSDVPGLTLAAVAFDDIEDSDGDALNKDLTNSITNSRTVQNNLYGIAAIGAYDPVNFQLWYANLENVLQFYTADLGLNFDLGGVKLGFQGQYSHTSFDSDWKQQADGTLPVANGLAATNSDFYALQAKVAAFGFDGRAGYVKFKAKNRADGLAGASVTSFEDRGSFIYAGEQFTSSAAGSGAAFGDHSLYFGDNHYYFVAAGYTFLEKFRVGADWVDGKTTSSKAKVPAKQDFNEWVLRASYAYSKKLKFVGYYSQIKIKDNANAGLVGQKDSNFRFQATYSF